MLDNDEIIFFKKYFNVDTPIDRTPYLLEIHNKSNNKLENIIENRLIDIFNKYENIYLLWSGGIDSTVVLMALIKHNIKATILVTNNTKIEYPLEYQNIINNKYNLDFIEIKTLLDVNFKNNYCILTGECGDQLLGSILYMDLPIKTLDKLAKDIYPEKVVNKLSLNINKIIKENKILTVREFLWGINFIYKWGSVINRLNELIYKKYNKEYNFLNFFENEDFQIWSLNNWEKNIYFENKNQYKNVFKEYIYNVNNDEKYFINKRKVGSLEYSGII